MVERDARTALPAGPFGAEGPVREVVEGRVERIAWRLDDVGSTTAGIAASLRAQLVSAGYEVVFECGASECGGFDFRFAVETLDAPAMYVDLSDYRYVLATRNGAYAALMVSRARDTGFVQLTRAVPGALDDAPLVGPSETAAQDGADLWAALMADGRAVLEDVRFATGSATLDGSGDGSLEAIADMLAGRPDLRLTIVGHTDTEGGLASNVALSGRRAEAVRRALVDIHGVNPDRIDAEGVGYLAPRASNATAEGRRVNRRVEIVLPE